MSQSKHLYKCPACGHRNFHAFPCMGTVAFQCASCKQISTHEQLGGGDTSGNPPEDATHEDAYGNFWKLTTPPDGIALWKRWMISGWDHCPHLSPRNPKPVDPENDA